MLIFKTNEMIPNIKLIYKMYILITFDYLLSVLYDFQILLLLLMFLAIPVLSFKLKFIFNKFRIGKEVYFYNKKINNLDLNVFFLILFFIFYFLFFFNNSLKFSFIWFNKRILFIKNYLDMNFTFDIINIYFCLLSVFIFFIIFFSLKNSKYINDINKNNKLIILLFLIIEFFLILTFLSSNIFFFFFFFECSLIPMFLLMILMGKGVKKKHYASLSLVFFTLTGSIFLLFAIIYLFIISNCCDFKLLNFEIIDFNSQILLFIFFIIGFSVKIPIFPFYSWLPEAHVEAATSISILLAALFLKVATYGLLKIVVFNMFMPINYLYSLILYFNIISIIVASMLSLTQTDLKKIIALSSVIHMNYIVIGIFSLDPKAVVASVIYMFSHAFVSTGLFYLVGLVYDSTGTRDLLNFSNMIKYSQNFYFLFFIFNLANISFPLTISFIAELMLLNNLLYFNLFLIIVILISIFISIIYTFWMMHNLFFSKNLILKKIIFLNVFDFLILFILILIIFVLGIMPFIIFYNLEQEIYLILINKFNIN